MWSTIQSRRRLHRRVSNGRGWDYFCCRALASSQPRRESWTSSRAICSTRLAPVAVMTIRLESYGCTAGPLRGVDLIPALDVVGAAWRIPAVSAWIARGGKDEQHSASSDIGRLRHLQMLNLLARPGHGPRQCSSGSQRPRAGVRLRPSLRAPNPAPPPPLAAAAASLFDRGGARASRRAGPP